MRNICANTTEQRGPRARGVAGTCLLTAECFVQAHNNIKLLLEQVVPQQPEPPELGLRHLPFLLSHQSRQSFIHYLSQLTT